MDTRDSSALGWYVARGNVKEGPYSIGQMREMLTTGSLAATDLVWTAGAVKWLQVDSVPEFVPPPPSSTQFRSGSGLDSVRPMPPDLPSISEPSREREMQPAPSSPIARLPWNPAIIAVLGLLFTPMWAGVMAALNGFRLRSSCPTWRPLAIGFGYLAASIALDAVIDSTILDWILYLGAGAVLWITVLRDQGPVFEQWRITTRGPGSSWVLPVVSGVPLAILAVLALVVGPLMPLEPRQVCERFMQASSEYGMKEHATKNLWPAIAALAKAPSKGDLFDGELTEEGPAPPDIGGYVVGFRVFFSEFGENHRREGFFHVVERSGLWKIDDVVVTSIDHRPLESWSLLSRDFVFMMPPPAENRGGNQANAKPVADRNGKVPEKQWFEKPGVIPGICRILGSRVGKGIGLTLLAALAVIAKFGKGLAKLVSPSSAESK
jgi:hypothetical protein